LALWNSREPVNNFSKSLSDPPVKKSRKSCAEPTENKGRNAKTKFGAAAQGNNQPGGLCLFFNNHFELRGDAVDQLHGDQRFAENLDGLIEGNAALVDFKALGF
jgi:hypothetical protein